ncbi:MAG TPA: prepilin-type N-terminal cleavage/methylation domain-containing protein [Thermoanaerobaculia bacterium]|nr:prepilin-type N-terminal cleavage/methylation domain-containing protein [Thermoanaerobaculia bacterium]HUM31040.1 prepilin-type N-terminal cleavage/methylation domain-containing protein [Thermoanaerobaculia bacterium]HXK69338.1 prepilin-type N-terminal cleavage/methylation domain-containing protein [Thermoanaerobaculia bacterium]
MKKRTGFTLVEMLVVIVIIGVIVLIAIPQFRNFYVSYKVRTATRMIQADMRSARQTAATRNRPVMVSVYRGPEGYYTKFYQLQDGVPVTSIDDNTKYVQIGNTVHYLPGGIEMKLTDANYTSFTDHIALAADTDTNVDIIFTERGESYDYTGLTFTEPASPTSNPASYTPRITLYVENKTIPNNHYFVALSLSGKVQAISYHSEVF